MKNPKKRWAKSLGNALSMGLSFAAAVGIGYYVGMWLDNRFNTSPYLMILMILLGVAAGIKMMYTWAFSGDDGAGDGATTESMRTFTPSKEVIASLEATKKKISELDIKREKAQDDDKEQLD